MRAGSCCDIGVHVRGLFPRGKCSAALLEQGDQFREGVAEKPRHPQRHLDPGPVHQRQRRDLEAGDALGRGIPDRRKPG